MFPSSSLKIVLQNEALFSNPYADDDTPQMSLRGSVLLNVNSTLKIKKLNLQFNGKLSMQFPATFKKARRDIIGLSVTLIEYEKATSISGLHTFPFEILVPSDLPESFRGKYGKIKYSLKAVAETSFINSDLKTEVPVQVHRNLNNILEEDASEYVIEDHIEDKLACRVVLPTSEYTPGEKFDIQVSALPLDDSVSVTDVTCTLKEYTYFHIPSKKDQTRVSVAEYMKYLSAASSTFKAGEHVKTLVVKTPEDSSLNCTNALVEVVHNLVVRIHWENGNSERDCVILTIPINIIVSAGISELDQLPIYCTIESPPSYHTATRRSSDMEAVPISLPPSYNPSVN